MRQILSTALVALIVGALAGASVSALAQSDRDLEAPHEVAAIDADTVDGRDAVAYTTNRPKRAGKIVATNKAGVLPSNIVKPQWRVIQNMPDGFADGTDDRGVTGLRVTQVVGPAVEVLGGKEALAKAECPSGSVVVGGGGYGSWRSVQLTVSQPSGTRSWWAAGLNTSASSETVQAIAVCMSTQGGLITTAMKGAALASRRSR